MSVCYLVSWCTRWQQKVAARNLFSSPCLYVYLSAWSNTRTDERTSYEIPYSEAFQYFCSTFQFSLKSGINNGLSRISSVTGASFVKLSYKQTNVVKRRETSILYRMGLRYNETVVRKRTRISILYLRFLTSYILVENFQVVLEDHPTYLSIYGPAALLELGCISYWFHNLYTVGRTPRMGDQSRLKPATYTKKTRTQNKRKQTSVPPVWFEPKNAVYERAKTVHYLDRATFHCDGRTLVPSNRRTWEVNLAMLTSLLGRAGERVFGIIHTRTWVCSWFICISDLNISFFEQCETQPTSYTLRFSVFRSQ
jgi:hypothetical protein